MGEPVVSLMVLTSGFQARVVAARLGADGIPVQLTGSVDGPCPVGTTTLWVLAADEVEARGLLLIDEAEWCLHDDEDDDVPADLEADAGSSSATGPGPLGRVRRTGLPLLLAIPLVGIAVSSLTIRLG
ncbi:MAG: hypothetical protein ACR2JF_04360 [Iamia sp.]